MGEIGKCEVCGNEEVEVVRVGHTVMCLDCAYDGDMAGIAEPGLVPSGVEVRKEE